MAENPNSPADWYADPADPTLHRWWDGSGWTDRLRPAAPLKTVSTGRRGRTEPAIVAATASPSATALEEYPELPGAGPFTYRTSEMPTKRYRPRVREETDPMRPATLATKNSVATVAVVLAILVTAGFAAAQTYGFPLTYLFGPSIVALATASLAFNRARRTGAGVVSSVLALVVTVPLTGIAIWAFVTDLSGLIP